MLALCVIIQFSFICGRGYEKFGQLCVRLRVVVKWPNFESNSEFSYSVSPRCPGRTEATSLIRPNLTLLCSNNNYCDKYIQQVLL